jgi:hypothetical protein
LGWTSAPGALSSGECCRPYNDLQLSGDELAAGRKLHQRVARPDEQSVQRSLKNDTQLSGNVDEQVGDEAKSLLEAKQYPRGETIFGSASKYIAEMSDDNFMSTWTAGAKNYLSDLYNPDVQLNPDLTYSPPLPANYVGNDRATDITRSIVFVPRQSQFGAIFTVLLDPRLKVQLPPLLVKLNQTVIQQQKIQYGQILTPLDQSGLFVAAQVRHVGNTRGNVWYTTVTGYTRGYCQNLLAGVFLPNGK